MFEFVLGVICMAMVWIMTTVIRSIHRKNAKLCEKADQATALVNIANPENGYYFNITKAIEELVNPEEKCVMDTGSLANAGEIYIEHLAEQIKIHPYIWRTFFQI